MAFDEKKVSMGSQDSHSAVVEQGETTVSNATKYNVPLVAAGMPTDTVPRLKQAVLSLIAAKGTQTLSRDGSRGATRIEVSARGEGKRVGRRARNAALFVLRDGPINGLTTADFKTGRTGESTREVIDYLAKLRLKVAQLEDPLKPFFNGQSPTAEIDRALSELRAAAGDQESKRAGAPLDTLALYQAQGEVIDLVERINLVARIAFDGQAEILGLFNKDILLRARRGSKKATTEPTPDIPVLE